MFSDLLRRLSAPDTDPLPEPDQRTALAALMVRIARADGLYAPAEKARIERVLVRRYGLDEAAATALRSDGEAMEAEAPDTVRFTRAIKDAVPYEDRFGVMRALWSVALADGERDAEEDGLLRLAASLLGVNDKDSGLARQEAQEQAEREETPRPEDTPGPWG